MATDLDPGIRPWIFAVVVLTLVSSLYDADSSCQCGIAIFLNPEVFHSVRFCLECLSFDIGDQSGFVLYESVLVRANKGIGYVPLEPRNVIFKRSLVLSIFQSSYLLNYILPRSLLRLSKDQARHE
jgi:hypothetical protein